MEATLAFSSLGCGELGIDEVFALAAAHGLSAVELRTLGGTTDILRYLCARFETTGQLRDLVAASGVTVASIDTSIKAIEAGPADRAWLLELMPWVIASGARRIRVFDGGKSGSDAELDAAGELVAWWTERASSAGWQVEMAIETHDVLAQPHVLQRFLDRVPLARLLWDTHHTWKQGGERPARTWRRLAGRTDHLHVKDSRSLVGSHSYVAPGEGEYPFDELKQALADAGFSGTISLEWERYWLPELPPIDTVLPGFKRVFADVSPHVEGPQMETTP